MPDGMIQEALAAWGANGATLPLDTGGGREMADVTSGKGSEGCKRWNERDREQEPM